MFSHIMVGSNDIQRSKKFYDALLGALGAKPATVDDKGRLIYMHNNGLLLVTTPIDGKPATAANGGTIGFACSSQAQVDAWHAAGVANGTYMFALPGSSGAVKDGWDEILVFQLDVRHMPCNFVELMPRLKEHLK